VNAALLTSVKESSSWPTVTANEDSYRIGGESQQSKCLSAMARRGEMSVDWRTPTTEALGTGEHMDSAQLKLGARVYNKNGKLMAVDLNRQVEILRRQSGQAAPASSSSHGSRQGLWATPRSGKTTDENPETWALRQAKGDVATMPLTAQVKMEDWPTVSSAGVTGGPTGLAGGSGNRAKMKRLMGGEMNSKLNSRWVETLMGLPIGWTMPSCTSPQTIAPMSCDSLAMELCQRPQSEPSEFFLAS
jgi:hypothetical protein